MHTFALLDEPQANYTLPTTLKVRITCSSGTYIRALARDLGLSLGTGGYLKSLRRTAIGQFRVEKAVNLSELNSQNWIDVAQIDMLPSSH